MDNRPTGTGSTTGNSLGETSIAAVRAAVYHYDPANNCWNLADGGLSRVDILSNPSTSSFRVIAVSAKTNDVC